MPSLNMLENSMKQRIDLFLANGSIFKPNKFFVGFYGPYVAETIAKLRQESLEYGRTQAKLQKSTKISNIALNRWLTLHKDPQENVIDLRWACKDALIPHVRPKIRDAFNIDATKSIQYPLVESYGGMGVIKLTIKEDRNMMMYQFFNALTNRFFTPEFLKPRSSFQKLGMYIAVLQEDWVNPSYDTSAKKENGQARDLILEDVVVHVYEFNSIVPAGMSDMKLTNQSPAKGMEFTIDFKAPNTFQGSFKTTFKGLRDYTTDSEYLQALDPGTIDKYGNYNEAAFETDKSDITARIYAEENSVYKGENVSKLATSEGYVFTKGGVKYDSLGNIIKN
jgi:hypothetical protein